MTDLRRQTITGVLWSASARIGQQTLQFAVTVVLARLLVPEDFGLVAMIAVFAGFASLFVDFGLTAALVQRRNLDERHLSTAFWMNIAAGLGLTALVAALAPALAALYGEPRLLTLALLLAANFALASPVIVQIALLQRAMNFRRLAAVEIGTTLGAGCLAIAAALQGLGVWSLIVQTLAATAIRGAALWLLSDWRPRRALDRQAARELWGFSSHLAGFSAVNYWSRNADNFLIGRFVGASGLGIYARAYSTMLLPLTQISAVIGRVMFPALSRIQDDPVRVKRAYLRAVGIIGLVTFPLATGLLVVAEPFVLALYGSKWVEAITVLQILCLAGLTQSVGGTAGWIYQSQGRTDWLFRWGLATSIITIAAFAIGITWGVRGVAVAYVVRTYALLYFNFAIPGKLIDMRFREVVGALRGVFVAAIFMAAAVWSIGAALPSGWSHLSVLITQVSAGAAIYGVLAHALLLRPYRELRSVLAEHFRPRQTIELPV